MAEGNSVDSRASEIEKGTDDSTKNKTEDKPVDIKYKYIVPPGLYSKLVSLIRMFL